jgi:hypothetical protein
MRSYGFWITDSQLRAPTALTFGEEFILGIGLGAGWGPRTGLDLMKKRKVTYPRRKLKNSSAVQRIAHGHTNRANCDGFIPTAIDVEHHYRPVQ